MTPEVQTLIPKTLIQFWDTAQLPDDIRPKVDSWAEKSGLTPHMFTEERALDFISEVYGAEYVGYFRKCALPAMKSDLFRLLAVYHHGGWYADCSIECLKSPIDLVSDPVFQILYYRRWHGGVNNGFFAATSKCTYLEKMIEIVTHNVKNEIGRSVWEVTGPRIWNDIFPKENRFADALELSHAQIAAPSYDQSAGKYVMFHQDLAHKKDGTHWSDAEKQNRSIFARLDLL